MGWGNLFWASDLLWSYLRSPNANDAQPKRKERSGQPKHNRRAAQNKTKKVRPAGGRLFSALRGSDFGDSSFARQMRRRRRPRLRPSRRRRQIGNLRDQGAPQPTCKHRCRRHRGRGRQSARAGAAEPQSTAHRRQAIRAEGRRSELKEKVNSFLFNFQSPTVLIYMYLYPLNLNRLIIILSFNLLC